MTRAQRLLDLGGTPEQSIADGKGTVYQVLQERPGSVAVVDAKTMKVTARYPFGDNGGCNGLALDVKNQILFAACSAVGEAPARGTPGQPTPAGAPPTPDPNAKPPQTFVMLSAKDGKILARLPLAGSSDGAAFNPATMEAFSTQGNGTMTTSRRRVRPVSRSSKTCSTTPASGRSRGSRSQRRSTARASSCTWTTMAGAWSRQCEIGCSDVACALTNGRPARASVWRSFATSPRCTVDQWLWSNRHRVEFVRN